MPRPDITRYTHATFWKKFVADILGATIFIVICSAYLTRLRASMLRRYLLAAKSRGVKIYIIMQLKEEWQKPQEIELKEFESVLKLLDEWEIPYELRADVHQKICIVDGKIVWEGSLNMMSYRRTEEQVLRHRSKQAAYWMQNTHNLFVPTDDDKTNKALAIRRKLGFFLWERRHAIPGMTQTKLAKLVHLERTEICRIERAEVSVSLELLQSLSKPLGFSIWISDSLDKNRRFRVTDAPAGEAPGGKDSSMQDISRAFGLRRQKLKMSIRKLARESFRSRNEVADVECNPKFVPVDAIIAIGRVLNINLSLQPL
jgi:transcriptional regulator with XRE-family HTH domain